MSSRGKLTVKTDECDSILPLHSVVDAETTSPSEVMNRAATSTSSSKSSCDDHNAATQTSAVDTKLISLEEERQTIILWLLAQVTALNDTTPKTFYAYVLDLHQQGIIEFKSMITSGLIPDPVATMMSFMKPGYLPCDVNTSSSSMVLYNTGPSSQEIPMANNLRPSSKASTTFQDIKTLSVKDNPIILSRYSRDFIQRKLIASGGFGQVFQATNKFDNCDYAIKRVVFSSTNSDTKQIDMVIREIKCLAQLGHENVIRYYTSWLESSWTTGMMSCNGGEFDAYNNDDHNHTNTAPTNRLLKDFNSQYLSIDEVSTESEYQREQINHSLNKSSPNAWTNSNAWNEYSSHNSNSIDTDGYSSFDSEDDDCSEWTINQSSSGHDISYRNNRPVPKKTSPPSVKYQICMYIQMELCKPTTLADWMRQRNRSKVPMSSTEEYKHYTMARDIFCQIARALSHIHSRGIIHRDLKPANIFQTVEGRFKIGDFGLSRLLKTANGGLNFASGDIDSTYALTYNDSCDWQDPLTSGVGTGSYAAPEQLKTQYYGTESDIFSLGLILVELFSHFGSAHERAIIFQNCRDGKLPNWMVGKHALLDDVGKLILACTALDKRKRPTASEIVECHLFSDAEIGNYEMKQLENDLTQSKALIEEQNRLLAEKDATISRLREELMILKKSDVES